jgi:hypothetical protein
VPDIHDEMAVKVLNSVTTLFRISDRRTWEEHATAIANAIREASQAAPAEQVRRLLRECRGFLNAVRSRYQIPQREAAELVYRIDAVLAAPALAPAWRPISEAPKCDDLESEKTEILAWEPWQNDPDKGCRIVLWWEPYMHGGCWTMEDESVHNPTHWQPLPPAPEARH